MKIITYHQVTWKGLQKMCFCCCKLDIHSFCKLLLFGKINEVYKPVGLGSMSVVHGAPGQSGAASGQWLGPGPGLRLKPAWQQQ